MFNCHEPNCCKICNQILDARDIDFVGEEVQFSTYFRCPHCAAGCYLVIETDDSTKMYECCYCHRHA
jgi:hypothetical protein